MADIRESLFTGSFYGLRWVFGFWNGVGMGNGLRRDGAFGERARVAREPRLQLLGMAAERGDVRVIARFEIGQVAGRVGRRHAAPGVRRHRAAGSRFL